MAKSADNVRTGFKFQYAVKFICTSNIPGTSQTTDAFLPGNYQTAVNIHNPQNVKVKFRKKLASPIGISDYFGDVLIPDGVARVTCGQVQDFGLHLIHGFEGFLVIESTHSIDVTAVYTAGGKEVNSIDVEQIKERKL
ncbi:MAG: hypothetical protein IPP15_16645 [Saprospiraceae bacterium]|uniref:Uncharacterized protein n=1 Tax=Candidatus Opimibacter skivensis TaxID=2982028 RepID=A0A9D7SXH3_9BACT|nr:hypothetical protein [Candidatus Opimibacter skivensis]